MKYIFILSCLTISSVYAMHSQDNPLFTPTSHDTQEDSETFVGMVYAKQNQDAWPVQRRLVELRRLEELLQCRCFLDSSDYDDRIKKINALYEKAREHAAHCDAGIAKAVHQLQALNKELDQVATGLQKMRTEKASLLKPSEKDRADSLVKSTALLKQDEKKDGHHSHKKDTHLRAKL